jgi:hypothetical protein
LLLIEAIVLGQRVIAEPAFIENPTPSIFSPAELEYDTRNSGALRPGETAIGMDKPASPESIAENDTGMAPGTISLTASGAAARAPRSLMLCKRESIAPPGGVFRRYMCMQAEWRKPE